MVWPIKLFILLTLNSFFPFIIIFIIFFQLNFSQWRLWCSKPTDRNRKSAILEIDFTREFHYPVSLSFFFLTMIKCFLICNPNYVKKYVSEQIKIKIALDKC